MTAPPIMSDSDILEKLQDVIAKGWHALPDKGYGGTGGPGMYLEKLLGLEMNNSDTPDMGKWELKYHDAKSKSLITLFHLEAKPPGHLNVLISEFGKDRGDGTTSFCHTVRGRSNKGLVVGDLGDSILVSNPSRTDIDANMWPRWTHDDILNAFASKLRRLIIVSGEKNGNQVRYLKGHSYENPKSSKLTSMIVDGTIAIDFDARTQRGTGGLRNHGTKFRIRYQDLEMLYSKRNSFT